MLGEGEWRRRPLRKLVELGELVRRCTYGARGARGVAHRSAEGAHATIG